LTFGNPFQDSGVAGPALSERNWARYKPHSEQNLEYKLVIN